MPARTPPATRCRGDRGEDSPPAPARHPPAPVAGRCDRPCRGRSEFLFPNQCRREPGPWPRRTADPDDASRPSPRNPGVRSVCHDRRRPAANPPAPRSGPEAVPSASGAPLRGSLRSATPSRFLRRSRNPETIAARTRSSVPTSVTIPEDSQPRTAARLLPRARQDPIPGRRRRPARRRAGPNACTPAPPGRSGHAPRSDTHRTGPAVDPRPNTARAQQVRVPPRPGASTPATAPTPASNTGCCSRAAAWSGTARPPVRSDPGFPGLRPAAIVTSEQQAEVAPSPTISRSPAERTHLSTPRPTAPAVRRTEPHRDCECYVRTRSRSSPVVEEPA